MRDVDAKERGFAEDMLKKHQIHKSELVRFGPFIMDCEDRFKDPGAYDPLKLHTVAMQKGRAGMGQDGATSSGGTSPVPSAQYQGYKNTDKDDDCDGMQATPNMTPRPDDRKSQEEARSQEQKTSRINRFSQQTDDGKGPDMAQDNKDDTRGSGHNDIVAPDGPRTATYSSVVQRLGPNDRIKTRGDKSDTQQGSSRRWDTSSTEGNTPKGGRSDAPPHPPGGGAPGGGQGGDDPGGDDPNRGKGGKEPQDLPQDDEEDAMEQEDEDENVVLDTDMSRDPAAVPAPKGSNDTTGPIPAKSSGTSAARDHGEDGDGTSGTSPNEKGALPDPTPSPG